MAELSAGYGDSAKFSVHLEGLRVRNPCGLSSGIPAWLAVVCGWIWESMIDAALAVSGRALRMLPRLPLPGLRAGRDPGEH